MVNPWEWLTAWVENHVNATVYDDNATARLLAEECLSDAKKAGVYEPSLIKAAGGDLVSFMLGELNSAVNREVDRQVHKDD